MVLRLSLQHRTDRIGRGTYSGGDPEPGKVGAIVTQSDLTSPALLDSDTAELSKPYQEGIVAGVIGAATIAI